MSNSLHKGWTGCYLMYEVRVLLSPACLRNTEFFLEIGAGWCVLPCLPNISRKFRGYMIRELMGKLALEREVFQIRNRCLLLFDGCFWPCRNWSWMVRKGSRFLFWAVPYGLAGEGF